MKSIYSLLAIILLNLSSGFCQNIFTKIPTPPHKHEVDIFFTHELPIKEPYFKTLMIEAQGDYDYNGLILQLKEKAQKVGADAIIITNKEPHYLAGIGLKYEKNNPFNPDSLKNNNQEFTSFIKKISIIPIDSKLISGDVNFNFDGTIKQAQQGGLIDYFIDNILQYDLKFLMEDQSNHWRENRDAQGRLTTRRFYKSILKNGSPTDWSKALTFNYNISTNKLESIIADIENPNGVEWRTEKLVPTEDTNGKLTELKVYWKDTLVRRQKLFYDNKNQLIMADWSRFEKGREIPFLRTEYHYYRSTDLQANN
jgi:hypothetical protein